LFHFEKWWIKHGDFAGIVEKVWNTRCSCTAATDIWQFKMRLLRKTVKGWDINVDVALKKKLILQEFDILDIFRDKISYLMRKR
jgi:hypothetical protein